MRNEVFLLRLQGLPVLEIFGKIHLKHCRINKKWVLRRRDRAGPRLRAAGRSGGRRDRGRPPLTSSAVQKEASAFLYICQMSWYWTGKMTNRRGFSRSSGSSSSTPRGTWNGGRTARGGAGFGGRLRGTDPREGEGLGGQEEPSEGEELGRTGKSP